MPTTVISAGLERAMQAMRCVAVRRGLAAPLVALALLAALGGGAAAATPSPLNVGATRILSAQYFESYAGKFLVVKARDAGAAGLTMSWFDDSGSTAAGSQAMTTHSDDGVYLDDSVLVPVSRRPDHVVVERDADNYSQAPVTDWASGAAGHPPGYLSDFQTGYLTPDEVSQKVAALAAQFPDIAQEYDLPNKTDGYRRRAQAIVGSTAAGSDAEQNSAAASAAVVLTSTAYGSDGGNEVRVELAVPAAPGAPLSVAVAGKTITVELATNAVDASFTTASQVVAAINASVPAAALASASTYRGNAGSGIVVPTVAGGVGLSDGLQASVIDQERGPQTVKMLRIGSRPAGSKTGVLITAWSDGRDVVTPLVALELAERLLRNYGTDPATTKLVDDLEIFIVPDVNPDGAAYATFDDLDQGKNMTPYCATSDASDPAARDLWGVDIDHNFSVGSLFDGYAGGSTWCTAETFVGPSELSEPESRNLTWLLSTFPKVKFAADLHAGGGAVTWSPGAYQQSNRLPLPYPSYAERELRGELAADIATDTASERGTVLLPTEVGAAIDVHGSAAGNFIDEAFYDSGVDALRLDVGADRMDSDGRRTPVGVAPPFNREGHDEAVEFADGLEGLLGAARAWSVDTTPPEVTTVPPPGPFAGPLEVGIETDEPATIHYTLDGSTPTVSSPTYEPAGPLDAVEPIQVTPPTTLKWLATDTEGNTSPVGSDEFRSAGPAVLVADPAALAFGDIEVGQAATGTVTVRNEGERPATLGTPTISGPDRDAVTIADDGCAAKTLAPGEECTLVVRLAPTRDAVQTATLSLPSDAPDSPLSIAIGGRGVTAPSQASVPPATSARSNASTPPASGPAARPRAGRLLANLRTEARCVSARPIPEPRSDVRVSFTLAARAKVKLTLQRRLPTPGGPRRASACPAHGGPPGARSRFTARIPLAAGSGQTRRVARTLTLTAGEHRIALLATLHARRLAPGGYRVVLRARATDGSGSQTAFVPLRILPTDRR